MNSDTSQGENRRIPTAQTLRLVAHVLRGISHEIECHLDGRKPDIDHLENSGLLRMAAEFLDGSR